MKIGLRFALAVTAILAATPAAHAADGKIAVVAAENFYGDVARQIGGDRVAVTSIISNPGQDPHLFETTPGIVREIAAAQIAILNGADYDPWMAKLLGVTPRPGRIVITVATLVGKKPGDNPHLWYEPATMPAAAKALAEAFGKADPAHAHDYAERLVAFLASLKPLDEKVAAIRGKYSGAAVTASEPVFGYMASALGLKMRNERFQLSIMNDTEPSARDIAAFEQDLKDHKVKVMFYNKQASDKAVQRLVELARKSKIPVVGVTETMPPGVSYQDWMLGELNDTDKALGRTEFMNVVELEHATIGIGGRSVLSDVSFAIGPGEFIGVLGPNGAGKTTLMRAILGLLTPSAGALRVFGRTPQRGDHSIGYLPQVRTVLPDLRVRGLDFIAASLNGERWGVPSLTRHDRHMIEETLDAVGAHHLALRPLSEMSGGERQRLLLAQSLIGAPKLLLLDEPLISLDQRHQEVAIDVVRKACRERGITVLFSAHELNQLLGTLDRVLYLGNGTAVLGTVEEVITPPVLSRLYGTEIHVVRAEGHIFVMSRGRDVEHVEHVHEHGDGHEHDHSHHH